MIDLVIYLDFAKENWSATVTPEAVTRIKNRIDEEAKQGEAWKLYTASSGSSDIIDKLAPFRHTFDTKELAKLDKTLEQATLFLNYYDQLGSDAFGALSPDRKK